MTIAFLGCGNMAQALIRGILAKGLSSPDNIVVADIDRPKRDAFALTYGLRTADSNRQAVQSAGAVVLCVKPQQIAGLFSEIKGTPKPDTLILSIVAGLPISKITAGIGDYPIIRAMPNTPALIGAGATGIYSGKAPKTAVEMAKSVFSAVGCCIEVDQEDQIDAVTAVSGSGPAYFFLLMEHMIRAAQQLGLTEDAARQLVLQTAKGAALLAESSAPDGQTPAILRQKVTSPGGTTAAAIKVFEDRGFPDIVTQALTAARDRGRELSRLP
jgi:pyrroline-5-carboxylate reductase